MKPLHTISCAALSLLTAASIGCIGRPREAKAPAPHPLRRTPLVEVFDTCRPSVVMFAATRVDHKKVKNKTTHTTHTQWAAGCVLHADGYTVANAHMLRFKGTRKAITADGKSYPVRLIASDYAHDLVLLKIDDAPPLTPLTLGDSTDLMIGEPAITIGNPFGIRFTMAAGIISGLGRSTNTEFTHLSGLIQTDASINPGSSGGPLLNILGQCIGVCVSAKRDGENIGYVIPIHAVRRLIPSIVAPEQRYAFTLGLTIATGGAPKVTAVAPDSPAHAAGIRPGDIITQVADKPTPRSIDVTFALIGRKGGDALPLTLARDGKPIVATVTLGTVPLRPGDPVAVTKLVGGLHYRAYRGHWKQLPDFARLKPTLVETIPTFGLGKMAGKDAFGLQLTGYIGVPTDGVYAFYTRSDDGSRLWIGDRLVVDNDGLHGSVEQRGFIPLAAGHHPIRVEFFEGPGDDLLEVAYEGPGLTRQPIPAAVLTHLKDRK